MGQIKQAVVLVNLGTPEAPTSAAVRRFLRPFLWDKRVVEVPRPIWWLILHGFILPFRPRRVAKVYAHMWQRFGDSPLRIHARNQATELAKHPAMESVRVAWAFTYGEPAIESVLDGLHREGIDTVVVVPMYPQYSATTTGAVYDQLADYVKRQRNVPDLRIIKNYCDRPDYIRVLAASVQSFWDSEGRGDHLLVSYHGIPKACVDKGDPYQRQCQQTSDGLAVALGLSDGEWTQTFQSRLGRAEWLKPYTAETVVALAKKGVKTLDVVCPAFSSDCIETVDEIAVENALAFQANGGERLRLIPALNATPAHIEFLVGVIVGRLQG